MINYAVVPRVNPQDITSDPKFYAVAQYVKNYDINEFAKHIASHGCVYSRADIAAVLTMAVDCIKEQLMDGNKVTLGDLGAFSITLNSLGTETREQFVPAKIYKVNATWTPGKIFRSLIDEAKFQKVSTRGAQDKALQDEMKG